MAIAEESPSRLPVFLLVGIAVMLLVVGAVYVISRMTPAPVHAPDQPLPMGAAEQAYVPHIQFVETQMARAANVLNQQITYNFGTVVNNGGRRIRQIEVRFEYQDVFGQTVLRETRRLFGARAVPLEPYARRDFQIGYETMPAQWNQAYPAVTITGLALE
jgi:hypothetical protein